MSRLPKSLSLSCNWGWHGTSARVPVSKDMGSLAEDMFWKSLGWKLCNDGMACSKAAILNRWMAVASRRPGNPTCCRACCNLTGRVDRRITAAGPSLFLICNQFVGPEEEMVDANVWWLSVETVQSGEGALVLARSRHPDIRTGYWTAVDLGPLSRWRRLNSISLDRGRAKFEHMCLTQREVFACAHASRRDVQCNGRRNRKPTRVAAAKMGSACATADDGHVAGY